VNPEQQLEKEGSKLALARSVVYLQVSLGMTISSFLILIFLQSSLFMSHTGMLVFLLHPLLSPLIFSFIDIKNSVFSKDMCMWDWKVCWDVPSLKMHIRIS
jgi:hypothetical protein